MKTALVTGASRGIGKGIATSLSDAGFLVFATGRTIDHTPLPNSIVRIVCDHVIDEQTQVVFEQIGRRSDTLDLLVNCAWGGYEKMMEDGQFTWLLPFWQQPLHRWTSMIDGGVRSAFICSALAARMMVARRQGLIVNLSYWAAQKYIGNTIYGVAKAATDKMSVDMSFELRQHNVAVISLYPGLVRTEAVLQAAGNGWLNLTNSESPEYIGRVIDAVANDPTLMEKSGKVLIAAELARGYGIQDTGGRLPVPLTIETA